MKHTTSNSLIIFSFLLMVAGCVKTKKPAELYGLFGVLINGEYPHPHFHAQQIYDYDNK